MGIWSQGCILGWVGQDMPIWSMLQPIGMHNYRALVVFISGKAVKLCDIFWIILMKNIEIFYLEKLI